MTEADFDHYRGGMDVAVLIPVKRFEHAKGRLASLLEPDSRVRLATRLADTVVTAAAPLPVFVACDDEAVAAWADTAGAAVLWTPGLGLNGAVDTSRATIGGKGFDHLVVAHSDLPLATDLGAVASPGTITLVPDRRDDGTNVIALPIDAPVRASYGRRSFRLHLAQALDSRLVVEVRRDPRLALDVDTPEDFAHPLIAKELAWLRTTPASRP